MDFGKLLKSINTKGALATIITAAIGGIVGLLTFPLTGPFGAIFGFLGGGAAAAMVSGGLIKTDNSVANEAASDPSKSPIQTSGSAERKSALAAEADNRLLLHTIREAEAGKPVPEDARAVRQQEAVSPQISQTIRAAEIKEAADTSLSTIKRLKAQFNDRFKAYIYDDDTKIPDTSFADLIPDVQRHIEQQIIEKRQQINDTRGFSERVASYIPMPENWLDAGNPQWQLANAMDYYLPEYLANGNYEAWENEAKKVERHTNSILLNSKEKSQVDLFHQLHELVKDRHDLLEMRGQIVKAAAREVQLPTTPTPATTPSKEEQALKELQAKQAAETKANPASGAKPSGPAAPTLAPKVEVPTTIPASKLPASGPAPAPTAPPR